jgi:hypothetical protein
MRKVNYLLRKNAWHAESQLLPKQSSLKIKLTHRKWILKEVSSHHSIFYFSLVWTLKYSRERTKNNLYICLSWKTLMFYGRIITSEVKRRHEMTLSLIELICMILCRLPLFPNKKLGREQLETLLRHRKGATKTRTQRMKIN